MSRARALIRRARPGTARTRPAGTGVRRAPPLAALRLARRPLAALLLLAVAAGLAGLLYLWWRQTPPDRLQALPDFLIMWAQLTGLIGAYLLLLEVCLIARVRPLERRLGSWLASAHRGLGCYLLAVLAAHVAFVVAGYSASLHVTAPALLTVLLRTYPGVLAASAGFLALLVIGATSARPLRRRLGYERWHAVHLLAYPAAVAAFFHQITLGAQFTASKWATWFWIALHVTVALMVLYSRVLVPVRTNRRHRFRVSRVERAGPDALSIYVTGVRVAQLGIEPGQYFRWRFLSRGLWHQSHPFSLSAAPDGDTLRLTVKCVGSYTRLLARRLRPGVRVYLDGPYGAFTGLLRRRPRIVLIGGGVGIAPLCALAQALTAGPGDIVIIQRVSAPGDLILSAELGALHSSGRIRYLTAIGSRGPTDPLTPERLRVLVPDLRGREVYICGSAGLTAAVTRTLRRLRVPRGRIHTELFDF